MSAAVPAHPSVAPSAVPLAAPASTELPAGQAVSETAAQPAQPVTGPGGRSHAAPVAPTRRPPTAAPRRRPRRTSDRRHPAPRTSPHPRRRPWRRTRSPRPPRRRPPRTPRRRRRRMPRLPSAGAVDRSAAGRPPQHGTGGHRPQDGQRAERPAPTRRRPRHRDPGGHRTDGGDTRRRTTARRGARPRDRPGLPGGDQAGQPRRRHARRITLKLSPEALGDVRVVLTVRHGDVHVRMIGSEQAQQALRAGAPELQRLLDAAPARRSSQVVVGDAGRRRPTPACRAARAPDRRPHRPPDRRDAGRGHISQGRRTRRTAAAVLHRPGRHPWRRHAHPRGCRRDDVRRTVDGIRSRGDTRPLRACPARHDHDQRATAADKDMFLQLLVAQMRYQDPMNPTDSSEFLAQTAQFTALEKMQAGRRPDRRSWWPSRSPSAPAAWSAAR